MEKKIHKFSFIRFILCIFLAFVVGVPFYAVCPQPVIAYAETTNDFDGTNVNEDLGEELLIEYAAKALVDLEKEPALYNFTEYCYSNNANVRNSLYGLYFYVYNPSRTAYVTRLGANTINMAVAYDENGAPTDYANLRLKYCGQSTGDYHGLFYKFRVMDVEDVLAHAVVCDDAGNKRRYDIAGIQLYPDSSSTNGTISVFDYGIGATYYFSGYSKGCYTMNPDESTLKVDCDELSTIELTVKHASWRGDFLGNLMVTDEINTVYFGVDNKYFEDWGGLQKIKAEWYEYKTNPVFATWDTASYVNLLDWINVDIGAFVSTDLLSEIVVWEERYFDAFGYEQESVDAFSTNYFYKGFNATEERLDDKAFVNWAYYLSDSYQYVSRMDWLFDLNDVDEDGDFKIPQEAVIKYMEAYTSRFSNQEKVLGANGQPTYAEGLFAESIDEDRIALLTDKESKRGHIVQEIDVGDEYSLTMGLPQGFWDAIWFGASFKQEKVDPIVVIEDDLSVMSESAFGFKYYIGETDRKATLEACREMQKNGQKPVLFRFAVTDYYKSAARFETTGNGAWNKDTDGSVCQETMFLGFDVIDLTFRKDGVDKVIAVVSNPIDIINRFDVSPPVKDNGCAGFTWWKLIIVLLFIILFWPILLPILQWLLPLIGKAIVWGIKAPFRFIRWLVDVFSGGDDG